MAQHFEDRSQENARRLRTYDALANQQDRTDLGQERLDLARSKQDFDQSFKTAEAERRATMAEQNASMKAQHFQNIADQRAERIGIFEQQAAINKAKADLAAAQLEAKNDRSLQVLTQATGFLKDARGMDPSKPEFDRQFQDLMGGYPMAAEHPSVKEWVDYHRPLRDKFVGAQISSQKPSSPQPDEDAKRLAHLESLRMKPEVDDDVKAYLDQEISKLRGHSTAPSPTPATTTGAAAPYDPNEPFTEIKEKYGKKWVINHRTKEVREL